MKVRESKLNTNICLLSQELESEKESRQKLESEVEGLKLRLKEEQESKKQITLLLLEDRKKMATLYLEEKKRTEDLGHLLRDEKGKVQSLGMGLEEETKRSLGMEAELERYLLQINTQVPSIYMNHFCYLAAPIFQAEFQIIFTNKHDGLNFF